MFLGVAPSAAHVTLGKNAHEPSSIQDMKPSTPQPKTLNHEMTLPRIPEPHNPKPPKPKPSYPQDPTTLKPEP